VDRLRLIMATGGAPSSSFRSASSRRPPLVKRDSSKKPPHFGQVESRKRAQSRRAIYEAALTLFGTKGYDSTTLDDIAELANVSKRTIFNYFPTKDAILFSTPPDEIREFQRLIEVQPKGLSDLDVLEAALVAWTHREGLTESSIHAMTRLQVRAVASSPVLRGRQADYVADVANAAAAGLAQRRGETSPNTATKRLTEMTVSFLIFIVRDWALAPEEPFAEITRLRFLEMRAIFREQTRD